MLQFHHGTQEADGGVGSKSISIQNKCCKRVTTPKSERYVGNIFCLPRKTVIIRLETKFSLSIIMYKLFYGKILLTTYRP